MKMKEDITLYTLEEAAEILHISVRTLRSLFHKGVIKLVRVNNTYRIRHEEILRFIEDNTVDNRQDTPTEDEIKEPPGDSRIGEEKRVDNRQDDPYEDDYSWASEMRKIPAEEIEYDALGRPKTNEYGMPLYYEFDEKGRPRFDEDGALNDYDFIAEEPD
jgi:excisionase family DNA binding protein